MSWFSEKNIPLWLAISIRAWKINAIMQKTHVTNFSLQQGCHGGQQALTPEISRIVAERSIFLDLRYTLVSKMNLAAVKVTSDNSEADRTLTPFQRNVFWTETDSSQAILKKMFAWGYTIQDYIRGSVALFNPNEYEKTKKNKNKEFFFTTGPKPDYFLIQWRTCISQLQQNLQI